ncbi:YdbL family protein [Skermanella sp. TT6]|uniref:YdbL family protein n=1 Tax=Skermanella cutis TaxID=2775420 RepID=A0ABX7B0H8_9PROT|nr:YdbL family protein [Skermanella sp. TT6]QQP87622.1 YdbL family protein [Skermanella sp. TT6]
MRRLLIVAALALGTGAAVPAVAQAPLDQAKQAGLVGERPDGLVGFVAGTVPADIRALVDRINAQRLDRYAQVARTNGASVESVQAVAGRQLIERTPAGQYVMTPSGDWRRK